MRSLRAATRNLSPKSSAESKDFNLKRVLFYRGNDGRLFQQNRSTTVLRNMQQYLRKGRSPARTRLSKQTVHQSPFTKPYEKTIGILSDEFALAHFDIVSPIPRWDLTHPTRRDCHSRLEQLHLLAIVIGHLARLVGTSYYPRSDEDNQLGPVAGLRSIAEQPLQARDFRQPRHA